MVTMETNYTREDNFSLPTAFPSRTPTPTPSTAATTTTTTTSTPAPTASMPTITSMSYPDYFVQNTQESGPSGPSITGEPGGAAAGAGDGGGGGGGGGGTPGDTMDLLSTLLSPTEDPDAFFLSSSRTSGSSNLTTTSSSGTQYLYDLWDWDNATGPWGVPGLNGTVGVWGSTGGGGGGAQDILGGAEDGENAAAAAAAVAATMAFNWAILLLAPLVVFGIAGNILVILAISLERRLQNVTNYFLLSLAVTDLLVSLIVMPLSIINEFTGRWLFGVILCNLFVTADVLMCTSSILHLCTISLERYIGIRYPLWAKNKSKRTVFFKIVLVWTLALAITSPITVLGIVNDSNILNEGVCLLTNQHFIIYGSIFAFFIPLSIMVLMYALTVRMLNKQAKLCSGDGRGGAGGGAEGGEGGRGSERQPVIRRSTSSRRHWSRPHHRHTVLGTSGSGSYRREPLTSTSSFPIGSGGGRSAQRYQPLSKRNTLPLCHERESSFSSPSTRESSDFQFCNGNGTENGSDELLDQGSGCKNKWRGFNRKRSSQSSEGEEPRRLKELVRKHHVALKAANILLMRRDVLRKENSSVQTEQKASKVLGVVFMIFVICWAPFFLVNILTVLCTSCYFSPTLFTVFVWLGYVSSTLNPIIYTVFNKVFKLTFLKLLCCRYGLLHRGRRRSQHHHAGSSGFGGARVNSSGMSSSSQSGLLTCSSFCRNGGGGSSDVHLEESVC